MSRYTCGLTPKPCKYTATDDYQVEIAEMIGFDDRCDLEKHYGSIGLSVLRELVMAQRRVYIAYSFLTIITR